MAEGTILVVGSLNMDQIVRVPRVPVLGETLLGAGSLKLVPGGKGANQAVAMARLGASVRMAGRVGPDPFGERLVQALQADSVDTRLIITDTEEASGVACRTCQCSQGHLVWRTVRPTHTGGSLCIVSFLTPIPASTTPLRSSLPSLHQKYRLKRSPL